MKCLHEKISESYQTLCRIIYRRKICCLLSQKLKYNGKNLIMKLISYREKIGENCSLIAPSVDLLALDRNISQITMIFNIMGKKLLFVGVHRSFSLKRCQTINIPLNHAVSSRCAYHFPSSHTY